MHRNRIILAITAALILAALLAYVLTHRATPPAYSGTIETREINIGSKIGGRVLAVHVEEGQQVPANAPLVTRAHTQAEAFQLAMGIILPSVFLSGYIFQISTMPSFFRAVSALIPATYYIQIIRGIVLRGSDISDLWLNALILTLMGSAAILLAAYAFVKQNAV